MAITPKTRKQLLRALITAALFTTSALAQAPPATQAPAFDVATIRPIEHDPKGGRFITLQGTHRFVARDYTLKLLIAAAYDLNPHAVSGGPAWIDSAYFNIEAVTPAERPTRDQQMAMLRTLLAERFDLRFHRKSQTLPLFELTQTKSSAKLAKPLAEPQPDQQAAAQTGPAATPLDHPTIGLRYATASSTDPSKLVSIVSPNKMLLPARNASMTDFASLLQRAILDRPVVDKTNLTGRFDFDLEWAPDETQFGGDVPTASTDAPSAPLFAALQEQLGLRLVATKGPVQTLVIDSAEQPSAN